MFRPWKASTLPDSARHVIQKRQGPSLSDTPTHSQTYTQKHAHSQIHPADNPPLLIPPHHGCLSPQGFSHLPCIYLWILTLLCCPAQVQVCVFVCACVCTLKMRSHDSKTGISWLNAMLTFRVLACKVILTVNKMELTPLMVNRFFFFLLVSKWTAWEFWFKNISRTVAEWKCM